MFKPSFPRYAGAVALALVALTACSGDEDNIPQKNRVSVLPSVEPVTVEIDSNMDTPQLASATVNTDWTHGSGNSLNHVGNLTGPENLTEAWSAGVGETYDETSETTAAPVIYAGVAYVLNAEGEIVALDAKTGAEKKRVTLFSDDDDDEINLRGGGLTVGDGMLFAATGIGGLYAIDPQSGKKKWQVNIRVPVSAPPSYANGKLYVIDRENRLQVFNAADGQMLWDYRALPSATARERVAGVAVAGNVIIAPFTSGEVLALDETVRRPAWGHNILGSGLYGGFSKFNAPSADPVIAGSSVYLTSPAGITVGIDGATGKILWQKQIAGSVTPTLSGNTLYMIDDQAKIIALNKDSGKVYFVTQLPAYEDEDDKEKPIFRQAPLLMNDKLFAVSSSGSAVYVNPISGKIEKTVDAPKTSVSPVIADGMLYILGRDGALHAYK